ncbi:signal peptidase II [Dolosicoccus paucivorans]|uniref:signal peptidase II n=1 Tax=Dolosicoccus paucivorans TaxID=84521 RepID=UPI0008870959|nr:signal peptidase II [Dolosicoccus paucivorans]SDI69637.1 signal peptidase II Aspartic peptidase. MEROPS family A08 [Dolosicoccus paucivorans]
MLEAVIIVITVVVDQLLKRWVIRTIPLHTAKPALPGVFEWFHLQNFGAGWGMFEGQMSLFYIVSIVALVYLGYEIWKGSFNHWLWRSCLSLLFAGTIGNLIDRMTLGYVTDMISLTFISFPVFNVADIALTLGVIGMIIYILKIEMRE